MVQTWRNVTGGVWPSEPIREGKEGSLWEEQDTRGMSRMPRAQEPQANAETALSHGQRASGNGREKSNRFYLGLCWEGLLSSFSSPGLCPT